jgi:16S rRNA (guanine(966)-N(2))-methyltransferase RsmD
MVRIIAGEFRRRLIETPRETGALRPLPDRVRVSTFNMLLGHLEGQRVVDVFAGCGSFGLEAISRGAAECVMIERDRAAADLLERNLRGLGVGPERGRVARVDALGPVAMGVIPSEPHVAFFDPPYAMMTDPTSRARVIDQFVRVVDELDPEGFGLLRTPWPMKEGEPDDRREVSMEIAALEGPETHVYGTTAVHWYMRRVGGASA